MGISAPTISNSINEDNMKTIILHQGSDEDALEMAVEVSQREFDMMEQIRKFSHENWEDRELDLLKEARKQLEGMDEMKATTPSVGKLDAKRETIKKTKKKPLILMAIAIGVVLLCVGLFVFSSNRKTEVLRWPSYSFPNVFSISIPPTMEMRNDLSITGKMINAFHDSQIFQMMCDECDLFYEKSQIVFQPLGMNSNNRQVVTEATATYARILFDFGYSDGVSQRDIRKMTRSDFKEYDEIVGKQYQTEYECMNDFLNREAKLIWHPSKKMKINGKYCIAIEYDRTGLEGLVNVKKYIFLYDGKEIDVTMSYRESEKEKYADDFEKVIKSFKINDK